MKHLDSGIIQAFLDGELNEAQLDAASDHLAVCHVCTNSLMEAESETAAIDFAFAAEKSLLCPTQRIWARLENEIDNLNRAPQAVRLETSLWHRFAAILPFGESFNFTASQVAFAGSFAAVLLFSLLAVGVLQKPQTPLLAENQETKVESQKSKPSNQTIAPIVSQPGNDVVNASVNKPRKQLRNEVFQISKAVYELKERKPNPQFAIRNPQSKNAPLPEEKNYLTAIAGLTKTVKTNDELVMRPSFRVQYEQNLAVMDNAISKMQQQVRRNPNDENARRILLNSYQNKIDLLNAVAEKSQMMATLR